ncbi:MAG TPA: NAD(P)/FAD-dependent oxidoreductase [Chitinophagaceae bacterium]
MTGKKSYDVIIIGGSYAGLSAAMALGRASRNVLIIDNDNPCNRQTPHSHNFITHDGKAPGEISKIAIAQVLKYPTIHLLSDTVVKALNTSNGFEVTTLLQTGISAKKLLFATGVTDLLPPVKGFAECWGISILHCPYCHGYEVKGQPLGVIGNGDAGFDLCKLIYQWSKDILLFTNGAPSFSDEQKSKLKKNSIRIVETAIAEIKNRDGYLSEVILADETSYSLNAVFIRPSTQQHCEIPVQLGCLLNEQGLIQTDEFQRTNVPGVYAAGDNCFFFRAVSIATASGTKAGAIINKDLVDEEF